jgi:protein gp37
MPELTEQTWTRVRCSRMSRAIHGCYAMILEGSNKAVAVSSRLKTNVRGMESEGHVDTTMYCKRFVNLISTIPA